LIRGIARDPLNEVIVKAIEEVADSLMVLTVAKWVEA